MKSNIVEKVKETFEPKVELEVEETVESDIPPDLKEKYQDDDNNIIVDKVTELYNTFANRGKMVEKSNEYLHGTQIIVIGNYL